MDGTILIMDYSSYERQKIRHIVEKAGSFDIIEVGGISQFRLLNLDIYDLTLVIMELSFPTDRDGFEVLVKLRASDNRDVPVIIVTRSDNQENKAEALKYAVNDYILKPYQVKRLESSIKSIIRIVRDFHYDTSQIGDIKLTFDDYIKREIKYSKRSHTPLSILLITTLQININSVDNKQAESGNLSSIYAIAAQKARESLRTTDTIFMNLDRDIIIVLPFTDEDGAKLVCEKIKTHMEYEFKKISDDKNDCIYPVSVTYPVDGDNFQILMEKAFKKISDKEMLEKIVSIPRNTLNYADKSYNRYRKWF